MKDFFTYHIRFVIMKKKKKTSKNVHIYLTIIQTGKYVYPALFIYVYSGWRRREGLYKYLSNIKSINTQLSKFYICFLISYILQVL